MLSGYRLKEMRRKMAEEERQELERRVAPMKAELAQGFREFDKTSKVYWSQAVHVLASELQNGTPRADLSVAFPKTASPCPDQGREAFCAFLDGLTAKTGYTLSEVGKMRLLTYCVEQCLSQNADLTQERTYALGFDRLVALDAFGADELGYDPSLITYVEPSPEPAPEPTIDALEVMETVTREGERRARHIISNAVFGPQGEAREVWNAWLAQLLRDYNFVPNPDAQKFVISWFEHNAKSFLDRRAYDEARRFCVRSGTFPPTMLTRDELLSQEIENCDGRGYNARLELMRRFRRN
jgi:hypothetical protein